MTAHQWAVMGFVIVLAIVGSVHPVLLYRGGESESFTWSEAFLVILILTQPPLAALGGVCLVSVVAQLAKRRPLGKAAFNVGQMGAAAAAAIGLARWISPPSDRFQIGSVAAATVGAAAFFVINNGAVAAVLTAMGSTWRSCLFDGARLRGALSASGVLAGAVLGVSLHDATWPILLAGPLLILVRHSLAMQFKAEHDRARVNGLLDATLDAHRSLDEREVADTVVRSARMLLRSPGSHLTYSPPSSEMAAPIVGTVSTRWLVAAGRRKEEPFEGSDLDLLRALAAVGSGAAANADLYRQIRYERERLRSVALSIGEGVVAVDLDGNLSFANAAAGDMVPLPAITTVVDDHLEQAVWPAPPFLREPALRCISSRCVKREDNASFPSRRGGTLPVAFTASPIMDGGRPTGAVIAFHDMTENIALEDQLRQQAQHDSLTGLANRRRLVDRLETMLSDPESAARTHAVMFVDVDRFKGVNDSLGHAIGDALLVEVSQRLRSAVRPGDLVARFGGDEFVILLEDVDDPDEASAVAKRMCAAVGKPMLLADGYEFVATVSVGIALSGNGRNADDLLRNADVAMYDSKRSHGGDIRFFDQKSMGSRSPVRVQLEADLRKAVEQDQIEVHYQPRFTIQERRIVGAEALVRWRHPQLGVLHPATFIDLAEETGLIIPVGRRVLEQAARFSREVGRSLGEDLPVTVNLSARQFHHSGLLIDIRRCLKEAGAEPSNVTFELTESMVMDDLSDARQLMAQLRAIGVNIAIDDFGTGHSSLGYLKRLPVQELKIDGSFVAGVVDRPDDRAIVRAVIQLAEAMNVTPVAEGIESPEQLTALEQLGCRLGQGHLIAPAVDGERLTGLLADQAARAHEGLRYPDVVARAEGGDHP